MDEFHTFYSSDWWCRLQAGKASHYISRTCLHCIALILISLLSFLMFSSWWYFVYFSQNGAWHMLFLKRDLCVANWWMKSDGDCRVQLFSVVACCCEGVEQLAGMSLENPTRLDATQQVCLSWYLNVSHLLRRYRDSYSLNVCYCMKAVNNALNTWNLDVLLIVDVSSHHIQLTDMLLLS